MKLCIASPAFYPSDGGAQQRFRRYLPGLRERGIEVLDLTPAMQEGARRGEQLFFEIDGHPNLAGYTIVAEAVSAYLRENAERYALSTLTDLPPGEE